MEMHVFASVEKAGGTGFPFVYSMPGNRKMLESGIMQQ